MDVREILIPVPWGHISAKTWGKDENPAVLVFHGLADNAGSFDRLMPLLPTCFYYVCVDFPSHGKSSPYPPHVLITVIDNVHAVKLVVEHFRRDKYILMGHSWGGQTITLYTQLYPQRVFKLVLFDSFSLYSISVDEFKEYLSYRFEGITQLGKGSDRKPTIYSYEEAVDKIMERRVYGELTRESAIPILERCLVAVDGEENKFRFNLDPRLKYIVNMFFSADFMLSLLTKYKISCPVLLFITSDSKPYFDFLNRVFDKLRKYNQNFELVNVQGNHDVHNNVPESVAPLVRKFLLNEKNKL